MFKRRDTITQANETGEVTRLIYRQDIRQLSDAISQYVSVSRKEDIWLLF